MTMLPEEEYLVQSISPSVFNRYPHIPIFYDPQLDIPLHKFEALRRAFYDEFSWCFRTYGYSNAIKEWMHHTSDFNLETDPKKQFGLLRRCNYGGVYLEPYSASRNEKYTEDFYRAMRRCLDSVFNLAQKHYQKEGPTHATE